jgi:cytoskeleton protein RodZ
MNPNTHPDNDASEADASAGISTSESAEQFQLFEAVAQPTMKTEQPDCANPDDSIARPAVPPEAASEAAIAVADDSTNSPELRLPASVEAEESLGMRLRASREARGMRCDEVAQQLKLPLATIQALEADRYERIGDGVYLRGYLTKYLRLLDLPQVLAERVLNGYEQLPPLITSGTVSRPRYLFQRYSVSALYLILTGVIIVPAVLLATRGGFEPNLAQITPLDAPDTTSPAAPANNTLDGQTGLPATPAATPAPAPAAPVADETPLVASLTPFPAAKREAVDGSDADKTAAAAMPANASGHHSLRLSLTQPSWVEIVASDGEKLDYGLLAAGTVRSYSSDKSIDVRLGNSEGASVEVDGKPQDLTPFRHSNVAHFKLSDGDAAISHSGN